MMRAAWFERQGPADEVLVVGETETPTPAPGEVLVRVGASGINPGEVKKSSDAFGVGMPFPRVKPHSDGAGTIAAVGEGVDGRRVGERVWCFGAQSYRPFGTAAEYVAAPSEQAPTLPDGVPFEVGACLGIPGITGHRAVHATGSVEGRNVLVQGGAGAVGRCAVALAYHAGARVIAAVRSESDVHAAAEILAHAPGGVDHVVEVAFDANIRLDERVLGQGGSIATYATRAPDPMIPFWTLVFKNTRIDFLGSDDFPDDAKRAAAEALNSALEAGWFGPTVDARYPLGEIARAHAAVEERRFPGRVVLVLE